MKQNDFKPEHNQVAEYAKAFSHPARVAIIDHLINSGKCICGDIVNQIPLSQSTISQHLKELKKAGIITSTEKGNCVCYNINVKNWNKAWQTFNQLFNNNLKCCQI